MDRNFDNYVFVPLGTRCSAAGIIKERLDKRNFSLPFDWIDMPIKAMNKFITLHPDQVESFVRNYFDEIDYSQQRHADGSWFPHDIIPHFDKKEFIDRYTRRHVRFNQLLRSGKKYFFISVFADEKHGSVLDFENLKNDIENVCGSENCFFVTVNLLNHFFVAHDNLSFPANHYNFYIPLIHSADVRTWEKWEEDICEKLKSEFGI